MEFRGKTFLEQENLCRKIFIDWNCMDLQAYRAVGMMKFAKASVYILTLPKMWLVSHGVEFSANFALYLAK